MKKIIQFILILSLAGCASPTPAPTTIPTSAISSCDPKDMNSYSTVIMPIYMRWVETIQKANNDQPADLSAEINSLLGIDGEFRSIFPPACLSDLHKALLLASDYMLKGFSALSSEEAEATVTDYFAKANTMLAFTTNELKKITDMTQ